MKTSLTKSVMVGEKESFMYTGKPYYSVTGLYYEGVRYYDPCTGRFVTDESGLGNPPYAGVSPLTAPNLRSKSQRGIEISARLM